VVWGSLRATERRKKKSKYLGRERRKRFRGKDVIVGGLHKSPVEKGGRCEIQQRRQRVSADRTSAKSGQGEREYGSGAGQYY